MGLCNIVFTAPLYIFCAYSLMDRMRDSGSLGYGSIPYRRTIKLSEAQYGFRLFIYVR